MNDQQLLDTLQLFCPRALPAVNRALRGPLDEVSVEWRQAVESLLSHLIEHDKALQSLTPGGSEYVNDRERCLAVANDKFRHLHEVIRQLPRRQTVIARHDPCGSVWRQYDGRLFVELDGVGTIFSVIPPEEDHG